MANTILSADDIATATRGIFNDQPLRPVFLYDQFGRPACVPGKKIGQTVQVKRPGRFSADGSDNWPRSRTPIQHPFGAHPVLRGCAFCGQAENLHLGGRGNFTEKL